MGLLKAGERVRVEPADDEGRANWGKALGDLAGTFPVAYQNDLDVVRVVAENGRAVEVPATIVKKETGGKGGK